MKKNLFLLTILFLGALLVAPMFVSSAQADSSPCGIACSSDSSAVLKVFSAKPTSGQTTCGQNLDLSCSLSFKGQAKEECNSKKGNRQRKYKNRKLKKACCTTDQSCKDKVLRPKDGCGNGIKCVVKNSGSKDICSDSCKPKRGNRQRKYKNRKLKKTCCTTDQSCKDKVLGPKDGCGNGIKCVAKNSDSKDICSDSCKPKRGNRQRKYKNRKLKKSSSRIGEKVNYISTNQLKSLVFSNTGFVLIDARSPKFDNGERIPGAVNFHSNTPDSVIKQAIPDKLSLVVVYCSSLKCPASHNMYERLRKMGYLATHEYRFGIDQWKKMRLNITKAE